MTDTRRAGAEILRLLQSATDPTEETDRVLVYAKDDGGTTKLYAIDSAGTITQLGGGGSGAGSVRVFRPGSSETGPVVFNVFDDLYATLPAALTAGGGQAEIYVDDTDESPAVLTSPDGAITYDLAGAKLIGMRQHGKTFLAVEAGHGEGETLVINNALWFEGLHVTSVGQDTAFVSLQDNEYYLLRTTFEGVNEFVVDVLGVTGVKFWLDHESSLVRTTNAAIRANSAAIVVNLVGNNTRMSHRCIVTGTGGTLTTNVYSPSARIEQDQLDIAATAINMLTSSGYYFADPNTKITAQKGVQVYDPNTGKVWVNTDGATAWSVTPFGKTGYVTLDTATEKTIFTVELPTVVDGSAYGVDFNFKLPQPVSGSQGVQFTVESGDAAITYFSISEGGTNNANRHYSGRLVISFGPVVASDQNVMRSWGRLWIDSDDASFENQVDFNGPELFATPLDQTLVVKIAIDLAADTGQEQQAHATISRLA